MPNRLGLGLLDKQPMDFKSARSCLLGLIRPTGLTDWAIMSEKSSMIWWTLRRTDSTNNGASAWVSIKSYVLTIVQVLRPPPRPPPRRLTSINPASSRVGRCFSFKAFLEQAKAWMWSHWRMLSSVNVRVAFSISFICMNTDQESSGTPERLARKTKSHKTKPTHYLLLKPIRIVHRHRTFELGCMILMNQCDSIYDWQDFSNITLMLSVPRWEEVSHQWCEYVSYDIAWVPT